MQFTSLIIAEGRGSMGGVTFSRNRYGAYTRARVTPVNPNTGLQFAARLRFRVLASRWTFALTQAQRNAWDLYGENVSWLNKLGQTVKLTGYAHYQRSNGAILAAGGILVDDAPVVFSLPEADLTFAAAISEATQQISTTFDNTLDWAGEDEGHLLVHMALPRVGSRLYIGPPTRTAGAVDGDSVTPPTSPALIPTPYVVAAGQRTEVLARVIRADARVSTLFRVVVGIAV
ncbi:hypothetical protein ES703_84012 [subsurface metagenome]